MRALMVVILLICLAGSLVSAAPAPVLVLDQKVNFSAANVSLSDALKPISEKTGIQFVVDEAIQDKITADMSEMPLSNMLTTLCTSKKWVWRVVYLPTTQDTKQAQAATNLINNSQNGSMIVQDPATNKATIILDNASPDKVKVAEIASTLGLNPVITIGIRRVPQAGMNRQQADQNGLRRTNRNRQTTQNQTANQQGTPANQMPVQDAQVQGVTQQIMSQFQGMTFDQQWQVMQEVRRQMRQNITPEQRDQMRQFFRQQRDQGQMGPNNGRNRRQ